MVQLYLVEPNTAETVDPSGKLTVPSAFERVPPRDPVPCTTPVPLLSESTSKSPRFSGMPPVTEGAASRRKSRRDDRVPPVFGSRPLLIERLLIICSGRVPPFSK